MGFSPTGWFENKEYAQRVCQVTGHLLKHLDEAEIPFGAVMLKPQLDIASPHYPEIGVIALVSPRCPRRIFGGGTDNEESVATTSPG